MADHEHLIILTRGKEEVEQACFAIRLALTLQCNGFDTALYLTANGSVWANKGQDDIFFCSGDSNSVIFYLKEFMKQKGKVYVCCHCYQDLCGVEKEEQVSKTMLKGVECSGIQKLVEMMTKAKVYSF